MKYRLDSHTHSLASGHAYHTIDEMARTAAEKKLDLLAITEHAPKMPGTCHEMYFLNLKVLPREMYGIEVLFGVELNILDYEGNIDLRSKILDQMDVAIASLHIPCIAPGTIEQNTNALVKAMENPSVNIIGHPDDGRYPVDFDTVVAAAKENHVLLELNNSSLKPGSSRKDARIGDIKMLDLCMKYKTPIIMNSDCHWAGEIGNHCYSQALVEELHFPEDLIVNRSVEEYKKFINRYKNK